MRIGAPYIDFAVALRGWMKERDYESPAELNRDLKHMMGNYAPSVSTVWMSFYGERLLPIETVEFMRQKLGFCPKWTDFLSTEKPKGAPQSRNQLALPGMREQRQMAEAARRSKR